MSGGAIFIGAAVTLIGLWLFAAFIWRPVVCFVCSRPMFPLGNGRFYCDYCKREGRA